MSNVRVNTVMDEELLREVDAYARDRREDRSTAIRQLVAFALREQQTREAVDAVRAGRMTLRGFATALDLDVWQAHDLLAASGAPVGATNLGETAAALEELTVLAGSGRPTRARRDGPAQT
ncbi:MAG: hypothetical protein AB1416_01660 [Actinomycetota bacterium]